MRSPAGSSGSATTSASRGRSARFAGGRASSFRRPRFGGRGELLAQPLQVTNHGLVHLLDVAPRIAKQLGHVFAEIPSAGAEAAADCAHLLLRDIKRLFDAADGLAVALVTRARRRG